MTFVLDTSAAAATATADRRAELQQVAVGTGRDFIRTRGVPPFITPLTTASVFLPHAAVRTIFQRLESQQRIGLRRLNRSQTGQNDNNDYPSAEGSWQASVVATGALLAPSRRQVTKSGSWRSLCLPLAPA